MTISRFTEKRRLTQTEAMPMAREWLMGGSRYGPNGQNLGPVSPA